MEDLKDTWRYYVQLNCILILEIIFKKLNNMCKLAVPLSLSLCEILGIKMFGFLFYTSLSHPAAPNMVGFLSLLLIYLYFSQVFFVHFSTPGWLFFSSIVTGQKLWKFPLFLEADTL